MRLLVFISVWLDWGILQTTPASSPNKNLGFLFAAYLIVWLLIVGYLFSLSRRQKKLAQEIEMLKQMGQEKPIVR
ncbi:CcmD family protein [candidate division KSB1 bacterium]|nr:CcmD family protein [candidate division KSB1 bacterium]